MAGPEQGESQCCVGGGPAGRCVWSLSSPSYTLSLSVSRIVTCPCTSAVTELTPTRFPLFVNAVLLSSVLFFAFVWRHSIIMAVDFQGGGQEANVDLDKVANLIEQSTLQSLRGVQHVDASGNPICTLIIIVHELSFTDSILAEPDLSNPTRPRFERPLDTIRSFEKAIDNGYKRRTSFQRAGMDCKLYSSTKELADTAIQTLTRTISTPADATVTLVVSTHFRPSAPDVL